MFLRVTIFSYSEPGTLYWDTGERQQDYLPPLISPCSSPGSFSLPSVTPSLIPHHKIASRSTSTKTEILCVDEVLFEPNFQEKETYMRTD